MKHVSTFADSFRQEPGRIVASLAFLLFFLGDFGLAQETAVHGYMKVRDDGAPLVGEAAPLFKLKTWDQKQEFDLKKEVGKKPIVLFFGSHT